MPLTPPASPGGHRLSPQWGRRSPSAHAPLLVCHRTSGRARSERDAPRPPEERFHEGHVTLAVDAPLGHPRVASCLGPLLPLCLPVYRMGSWEAIGRRRALAVAGTSHQSSHSSTPHLTSLNFSQFVEGRRWGPWVPEGLEEARAFAGDEPCHREERRRASARCDARQTVRN